MSLESLLEEVAQQESINVDPHNHGQTGTSFREEQKGLVNKIWGLLLSEGFSDLTGVFDRVMESPSDGVYITNFNDFRYENWTSAEQLEIARKAGYEVEQGQYFTFFKKKNKNKVKFLAKSQEVPTKQAHILFCGLRRWKEIIYGKDWKETLKEANDGEGKIADHSFLKVKGQEGILAHSKNPEEDAKYFDALEENGNSYFPFSFSNWKVIRFSRRYKKPVVAGKDGHHPKDISNCYNTILFKISELFF